MPALAAACWKKPFSVQFWGVHYEAVCVSWYPGMIVRVNKMEHLGFVVEGQVTNIASISNVVKDRLRD
jgi:hypothetical protein